MDEASAASQLEVDMARDCVTCEVPFGGVLFLNNIIPHRSVKMVTSLRAKCCRFQRYQGLSVGLVCQVVEQLEPGNTVVPGSPLSASGRAQRILRAEAMHPVAERGQFRLPS